MSYSPVRVQRIAEVLVFTALCLTTADLTISHFQSQPDPVNTPVRKAVVAAMGTPSSAAFQSVLGTSGTATPTPGAPQGPIGPAGHAAPAATPPPPPEPLPVLTGTLGSGGMYLAILQSGAGAANMTTQVLRKGQRVGSYQVAWVGPYKACVKDHAGQTHILALGSGSPNGPSIPPPPPPAPRPVFTPPPAPPTPLAGAPTPGGPPPNPAVVGIKGAPPRNMAIVGANGQAPTPPPPPAGLAPPPPGTPAVQPPR